MTIWILDDAEALAAAAAQMILETACERPAVGILLAGGTTPRRAYERVAAQSTAADFAGVHLWFGDERAVPPDHPDSNHGMVAQAWLTPMGYPPALVHRIRGELGGAEAARVASEELRAQAGDTPRLDLVLLGIGTDGHTASLFPGDPAVDAPGLFVAARGGARVSATVSLLSAARRVIFLAAGAAKAAPVAAAVTGPRREIPASLVTAGEVVWLLDRAAAQDLPTPPNATPVADH